MENANQNIDPQGAGKPIGEMPKVLKSLETPMTTTPTPSSNNLVVQLSGEAQDPTAETIDGAATKVINANYGSVSIITDGTNWFSM